MILPALFVLLPLFALAQEHAIYRSVDRGLSWAKAGSNLAGNPRINGFGAIGDRILAGTDSGIYWSGDAGKTWRKTSATARTVSFATSGQIVYAGTQSAGLLASRDQGGSWTPVAGLGSRHIRSLLAARGRLYAGTDADGVMVSEDEGRTWLAQNAGLPPLSQSFDLAKVGDTVFAALYAKGLYALGWNERRWVEAGKVQPLVLASGEGTLAAGHNPGGIFWSAAPRSADWRKAEGRFDSGTPVWAMASNGKLIVAGAAEGIYRSEDGGRSWSRTLKGLPVGSAGVSFLVRGSTIYAGLVIAGGRRK